MELKVVELFAGVGGFRVGLNNVKTVNAETGKAVETGDWDFVWANQYEPATKTQHALEIKIAQMKISIMWINTQYQNIPY